MHKISEVKCISRKGDNFDSILSRVPHISGFLGEKPTTAERLGALADGMLSSCINNNNNFVYNNKFPEFKYTNTADRPGRKSLSIDFNLLFLSFSLRIIPVAECFEFIDASPFRGGEHDCFGGQ